MTGHEKANPPIDLAQPSFAVLIVGVFAAIAVARWLTLSHELFLIFFFLQNTLNLARENPNRSLRGDG